jgi:hypothetical protein
MILDPDNLYHRVFLPVLAAFAGFACTISAT